MYSYNEIIQFLTMKSNLCSSRTNPKTQKLRGDVIVVHTMVNGLFGVCSDKYVSFRFYKWTHLVRLF